MPEAASLNGGGSVGAASAVAVPLPPKTGQILAAEGVGAGGAIGSANPAVLALLSITVPPGSRLVIDASAFVLNGGVAQDTFTFAIAINNNQVDSGQVAMNTNARYLLSRQMISDLLAGGTYTVTLEGQSQGGRTASTAAGGARINAFAISTGA